MIPHTQTILAERPDGHSAAGMPGDCLRTAVAAALDIPDPHTLPHFAVYTDWWVAMRRWARARGCDFGYLPVPIPDVYEPWLRAYAEDDAWPRHVILGGPSPRGTFEHVVVGDYDLNIVHDPHPSRAGLSQVTDVTFLCLPYYPAPYTRALTA